MIENILDYVLLAFPAVFIFALAALGQYLKHQPDQESDDHHHRPN